MSDWKYGDAWEQFPVVPGERWGIPANGSVVAVHDIFRPLPTFMQRADMLFVDPPYNGSALRSFYTKAGLADAPGAFGDFEETLFQRVAEIDPAICYLEVGRQAVDRWQAALERRYPVVQRWDAVYYGKHPCYILRAAGRPQPFDYSGMDEADVIATAARIERYDALGDLCMGQGLVGLAAWDAGRPFVGTELNKRRLAVLLQRLQQRGATVRRY